MVSSPPWSYIGVKVVLTELCRMNRRKADFKFAYKFLEDDL